MNNLRLGSGRQFRSAALVEMPLPLAYDAALLPGTRILGSDGQIYESMRDPVSGLYQWRVRAQGERGPAVELQKSATHIQWRPEGSTGPWFDLVPLEDLLGPQGDQGDPGPQGAGLSFQGSVNSVADLPTSSTLGYGYLVLATTPPHLWLFNGTTWLDAGPIQGPKGDDGDPGPAVELRTTATEIQWRIAGAANWTTLLLLADIKGDDGTDGADGSSVELRKTASEIQWRLVGAPAWITLVTLDDIRGPAGDQGDQGPPGAGFAYQGSVATVAALPVPSTQGFGFKVQATGDLHIFNGIAWVNAGPLQGPKGDTGDQGNQGPAGPGFSYQGTAASVAALPTPSTQGFAFRIGSDLYIYNGIDWVNAGPLLGPKGDQGDQGVQGVPGNGFAYQGSVATVAALPVPSTQGFGFKVQATGDLHIFNGIAWVNAGPLQGPQGEKGDKGDTGNTGTAATIQLGTVSTGAAGSAASITNSGTPQAAVFNFTIPRGDKGDKGDAGTAATYSSSNPQPLGPQPAPGSDESAARIDHVHQLQSITGIVPLSTPTGTIALGELDNSIFPEARTLVSIPIWSVKTAPAGLALQFDIRVGGTSIFSTLPTIAIGGTSSSSTTQAVFSTAFLAANQLISAGSVVTWHCTQAATSGGAGLKCAMTTRRAV
jgi:hypothetical protein